MKPFIDERKRKNDALTAERTNWNNAWQLVAQYIWTVKANFLNKDDTQGEFLNSHLYDNSANKAMKTRASALVSLLWGDYKIVDVDSENMELASINEYFEHVTKETKNVFKKTLIEKVLLELEKGDAVFGTDCMLITEDINEEIIIQSIPLEQLYLDEDSKGFVDTVYHPYSLTAQQMVEEFGEENVHEKVRGYVKEKLENKKINVLHLIQPYANSFNKPPVKLEYESTYIDLDNEHLLKSKGFFEKPFMAYRENKKDDEKYGRGCGMETISNILQANANGENYIESTNKQARPSKGVFAGAMPSNGIIDLSPDSVTVFNDSGIVSGRPIFNLEEFVGGNLEVMRQTAIDLREVISSDFDIDRLLDLGTDRVEMTAYEVRRRAIARQQSLGGMLKTKVKERYDPMMNRIIRILYRQGKLGYTKNDPKYLALVNEGQEPLTIPDKIVERIAKKEDVFEVVWFTANAREEQFVKNESYLNVWRDIGMIAELTQDGAIFDNLDKDKTAQLLAESSFSSEIIKDEETRNKDRANRAKQQQTQQTLAAAEQMSIMEKNLASSKK